MVNKDPAFEAYLITLLVYGIILVPIYVVTLWKVQQGEKLRVIVVITSLLLISAISYTILCFANYGVEKAISKRQE